MSLPDTFVVRLNSHTTVLEDGAALLGGSPTRYVRLSEAARSQLSGGVVRCTNPTGAALANKLLELAMAEPVFEELPESVADYTIVIPIKDRADALARLLESIRTSTLGNDPRIIVVDDASDDVEPIRLVAERFHAELLPLSFNVGPGGARNAGLAKVSTEFVVFLDSDLGINRDTIPVLMKHFADPLVAMVVPRIVGMDHDGSWINRYENARSSLDLGPIAGAVKPRSPLSWAPSAGLAARVSALGEGFDPTMRVGEDVDMVWRLHDAGWRIRYEPASTASHEHRVTLGSWFRRKAEYGTGAVPLAKRHPDYIAPAVMAPWNVAVMASLLTQRKWSIPVAAAIAMFATVRNAQQLKSAQQPLTLATSLTLNGLVSGASQTSALMLKHWWPLTAIACIFSRRIRNATFLLAVTDIAVEYEKSHGELDVVSFGAAKTLDDIAYGTGVWLASIKGRTIDALKPDWRWGKK